jgi:hypothetical protein
MLMLADAGQELGGKLYILGGGWSVTGPAPQAHVLVLKVDIPWDQANTRHRFRLALQDADGKPVVLQSADGEEPLVLAGEFEAGRPAGLPPGTDLDFSLVANVPPLALPPGQRFEWRVWIDDRTEDDWVRAFLIRDQPAPEPPRA